MDHLSTNIASFIKPEARINEYSRRHLLAGMRYSSGLKNIPKGDMYVAVCSEDGLAFNCDQLAYYFIC